MLFLNLAVLDIFLDSLGPVSPLEEISADPPAASLPPGKTPTIFDVDDYQSLVSEVVDQSLAIPEHIATESEHSESQSEHEYVRYMYEDYAKSELNGVIAIPDRDLPQSVTTDNGRTVSDGGGLSGQFILRAQFLSRMYFSFSGCLRTDSEEPVRVLQRKGIGQETHRKPTQT